MTKKSNAGLPARKNMPARVVLSASYSTAKLVENGTAMTAALTNDNVTQDGSIFRITGASYRTDNLVIPDVAAYFKGPPTPGSGITVGEADKVAWRDPATGYECIMLRSEEQGYLSGYVGVQTGHPMHGFHHNAIPEDLGVEVHGGLSYSAMCKVDVQGDTSIAREARRICHTVIPAKAASTYATAYRVQDRHAWWFGFDCNHLFDIIPALINRRRLEFFEAESQAEYRNDDYVCLEILNLARQLKAIEDGLPPPDREGYPLPPAGSDPANLFKREK